MIVFDLKCGAGHVFEAWFGSSAEWQDQRARNLVACPLCGDTVIAKALMTPNVAAKGNRGVKNLPVAAPSPSDDAKIKEVIGALAKAQAAALENSTWVGDQFDRKARAMDAGDAPTESIHGEVTRDQAKALIEDGVSVMPLPLPVVPPEKRN